MGQLTFSVFTKPWNTLTLPELGEFVRNLGFEAVELPVRPGYQVEPADAARGLPEAAKVLADFGIRIASVAGHGWPDESIIAACADSGVPIIRAGVWVPDNAYMATEARAQRDLDSLVPLLEGYGVTVGIQNHIGSCVCNSMGLRHLVEKYDPRHIAAIWDAGHNGLCGEDPEIAIDIVWSHLCLVNLKSAYWQRTNGPEAEYAEWSAYWTTGRHGRANWPRVAAELKRREYRGVLCLTAEYNDHAALHRLILEDIAFAKSLFHKE